MKERFLRPFRKVKKIIKNVFNFYVEGFRSMTLGKTLWLIILIKLFIMFCILRPFFFPRYLNEEKLGETKEEHVAGELIDRGIKEKDNILLIDTNKK